MVPTTQLQKWALLSEKDISPAPWFPLFKQKVKLSNGKILDDFYISKLGDVGTVIPITNEKKIIMTRQYKHGYGDITIELPAGRMKKGESALDVAKRELFEETGYRATKFYELGFVVPAPTKDTTRVYGFIATGLQFVEEAKGDGQEVIELLELSLAEIKKLIVTGEIIGSDAIALLVKAELMYPEVF